MINLRETCKVFQQLFLDVLLASTVNRLLSDQSSLARASSILLLLPKTDISNIELKLLQSGSLLLSLGFEVFECLIQVIKVLHLSTTQE